MTGLQKTPGGVLCNTTVRYCVRCGKKLSIYTDPLLMRAYCNQCKTTVVAEPAVDGGPNALVRAILLTPCMWDEEGYAPIREILKRRGHSHSTIDSAIANTRKWFRKRGYEVQYKKNHGMKAVAIVEEREPCHDRG